MLVHSQQLWVPFRIFLRLPFWSTSLRPEDIGAVDTSPLLHDRRPAMLSGCREEPMETRLTFYFLLALSRRYRCRCGELCTLPM